MSARHFLSGMLLLFAVLSLSFSPAHLYADGGHEHGEPGLTRESIPLSFRLYRYVKPLGIAAYCSLGVTFLLGLLKFKFHVRKIDMRWHYGFAILTLSLATLHASLVLYAHGL